MFSYEASHQVFDAMPVGVFTIDLDLRNLRLNRFLKNYLGIPQDQSGAAQAMGLPALEEVRDKVQAAAIRLMAEGGISNFDFSLDTAQGKRVIGVRLAPWHNSPGATPSLIGITFDITSQRRVESALDESQRRFAAFMDHVPAIAWIKDKHSRYVYSNKAHRDRFSAPGEDWTGRSDHEYFDAGLADIYNATDRQVLESGEVVHFETSNRNRHGGQEDWWIDKFPLRDEAGEPLVGGIGANVSELKRLERELRESEMRFQSFLDNIPALVWLKDEQGRYQFINRAYKDFLGVQDESWRQRSDFDLFFEPGVAQRSCESELEILRTQRTREDQGRAPDHSGRENDWLLVRFPYANSAGERFIGGVATNVTARQRDQDLLRQQALTDELTCLYNRRGFQHLMEAEIRHAIPRRLNCALLFVDLDGLKRVNDTHGHEAGDRAIAILGEVLRMSVREGDIIGRMGGDEFAVFAPGCLDALSLRQRILDGLRSYNSVKTLPFELSGSIGIVEFEATEDLNIDRLLAEADAKMYKVKRARVG